MSTHDSDSPNDSARRGFLVERGIGFRFAHPEIAGRLQRTFLDQYDGKSCVDENFGCGAAACARSHDDNVGLDGSILRERGCVDHVPAGRDALADRVGDRKG